MSATSPHVHVVRAAHSPPVLTIMATSTREAKSIRIPGYLFTLLFVSLVGVALAMVHEVVFLYGADAYSLPKEDTFPIAILIAVWGGFFALAANLYFLLMLSFFYALTPHQHVVINVEGKDE